MDNFNYPVGSDNSEAPWNNTEPKEEEVEVTVSLTISKTIKIKSNNYTEHFDVDEEGHHYSYIEWNNLKRDIEDKVTLPHELAGVIGEDDTIVNSNLRKSIEDCKDWVVDDFEVVLE